MPSYLKISIPNPLIIDPRKTNYSNELVHYEFISFLDKSFSLKMLFIDTQFQKYFHKKKTFKGKNFTPKEQRNNAL